MKDWLIKDWYKSFNTLVYIAWLFVNAIDRTNHFINDDRALFSIIILALILGKEDKK